MDDSPMPSTSGGDFMIGSLSNKEKLKFLEEERKRLYQQLDDKDEEINQQSQYVEKLKEQMEEQKELTASARRNYEQLQQEMNRIQQENESVNEEAELTNNELESKSIRKLLAKLMVLNTGFELCNMLAHQRKGITEMLTNCLKKLEEIDGESNENLRRKVESLNRIAPPESNDKVEEKCTEARLSISKMKSKMKNLMQQRQGLESFQVDCNKKVSDYEKDLTEYRLLISELEAYIQTLTESMKETETRK